MLEMLEMAGVIALPNDKKTDPRHFWLGAIGIRDDGAMVSARNGAVQFCDQIKRNQLLPGSHAENRCLKKMGCKGTLYVARISKSNGDFAMSRPCMICRNHIKAKYINKVYYTIDANHYGIWHVKKDFDQIIDC